VRIDLAGLSLELNSLDEALAERLFERYTPYATRMKNPAPRSLPAGAGAPDGGPSLSVEFRRDDREYFIDPPAVPELNPVLIACDPVRIRYLGYRLAGWFDTRARRGAIVMSRGEYEPDWRALENYVRVAVAWLAAGMGGALVHAASAVLGDKGYLFYGPSGAGKSTLSACNTRARVVSDDLSLLLPASGGGLSLIGSPFRGTYTGGDPVVGTFPLVAGFRIVKGARAEVVEQPRVRVLAELFANLPFLVDAFPQRPELFSQFERTFAALPLRHLYFSKTDDSYWDAIARSGL
jgi:hypothetical protein